MSSRETSERERKKVSKRTIPKPEIDLRLELPFNFLVELASEDHIQGIFNLLVSSFLPSDVLFGSLFKRAEAATSHFDNLMLNWTTSCFPHQRSFVAVEPKTNKIIGLLLCHSATYGDFNNCQVPKLNKKAQKITWLYTKLHAHAATFNNESTPRAPVAVISAIVVNALFRRRGIATALLTRFLHDKRTSRKVSMMHENIYCRANSLPVQNLLSRKFSFDSLSQVSYTVVRDKGQLVFDNIEGSDSLKLMCRFNFTNSNLASSAFAFKNSTLSLQ